MSARIVDLVWVLAAVLLGAVVLAILALIVLRVVRDGVERRRKSKRERGRRILFVALAGDIDDAATARLELLQLSGPDWALVEEQLFSMLAKVKGESRESVREVLLAKGAQARAVALASSRSTIRRCRGAHRLGVLGQSSSVPTLVTLLSDHSFLPRRVAVRALAAIADPGSATDLMRDVGADPQLHGDLLYALDQIGPRAVPALREHLASGLGHSSGAGRQAEVAAAALGLVGDVSVVALLVEAMERGSTHLRVAAATALGRIGSPAAIGPLQHSLSAEDVTLQIEAAKALGLIGSPACVPALSRALDGHNIEVGRKAAEALLRLDTQGFAALCAHPSPLAAEAVALAGLRVG